MQDDRWPYGVALYSDKTQNNPKWNGCHGFLEALGKMDQSINTNIQ
jgi:hypothetical protein